LESVVIAWRTGGDRVIAAREGKRRSHRDRSASGGEDRVVEPLGRPDLMRLDGADEIRCDGRWTNEMRWGDFIFRIGGVQLRKS
jgi:hypothetical protein